MGPKRRYPSTSLGCAASQKNEDLNYTAAEYRNLAWKDMFLVLISSYIKWIYTGGVSASKLDVSRFSRFNYFHKNHMLKFVYSSSESSSLFGVFVLISACFIIWSNWVLMHSGRPLLWHWSFTTSQPDPSCRHFAHIQIWWRFIKLMSFVTDPWFSNQQHLPGRGGGVYRRTRLWLQPLLRHRDASVWRDDVLSFFKGRSLGRSTNSENKMGPILGHGFQLQGKFCCLTVWCLFYWSVK
jgi:hypothetical protein